MYIINLEQPIHVHFIGIGGISMSGLAEILINRGFKISGSDINMNPNIVKLENLGARITRGHIGNTITDDIDLIVYTVAVKDDNIELITAKELGLPIIDRATLLGQVMDGYKDSIAVSGTHGKTTTTSMIAHILDEARVDPTISVGGILPLIDGNIHVGQSSYFITEACEYYDSFFHFYPKVAVILNIEEDHMDYFEDIHQIRASFKHFLSNVKNDGTIVINKDIPHLATVLKDVDTDVITYSVVDESADYTAKNISYNPIGHPSFDVFHGDKFSAKITLTVPGVHNVSNALAAYITGLCFGISIDSMTNGLKAFAGTHRRFEYKGSLGGVTIIDDYAHHPTEIAATIASIKHMDINKLWIVFQPHTFSRTKAFLNEFAEALSKADHVILLDIYSAREKDDGHVHSKDMATLIEDLGTPCEYFASFDESTYYIMTHCVPSDLLITMGAGDVYLLGESLLDL